MITHAQFHTTGSAGIQALAVQLGAKAEWASQVEEFLPLVITNHDELPRSLTQADGKLTLDERELFLTEGHYLVYVHRAEAFAIAQQYEDVAAFVVNYADVLEGEPVVCGRDPTSVVPAPDVPPETLREMRRLAGMAVAGPNDGLYTPAPDTILSALLKEHDMSPVSRSLGDTYHGS